MRQLIPSILMIWYGFLYAEEFQVSHIVSGVSGTASKTHPVATSGPAITGSLETFALVGRDLTSLIRFACIVSGTFMLALAVGQLINNRDNPTGHPLSRVIVLFILSAILFLLPFIPAGLD